MLYISHTGCQWGYLHATFGPRTPVWSQFRRWSSNGTWARALAVLHESAREADGRRRPHGVRQMGASTAACCDAQHAIQRRSGMRDEELAEVNSCLGRFEVTMYRGGDGKYRIWGDINRIQDIIFSDCVETFPAGARAYLDWFFAHEVDAHVARNFERLALRVAYDPADKIGFSFDGDGPSDEQMTAAFRSTYDWYSIPPEERVEPRER